MARDISAAGFPAGRALRPPLEPQIRRYDKSVRKRLRRLAKTSPRLGDLIFSFPAAAFALAVGRGPVTARQEGVRLVKDGAPLPAVAAALELPLWTRRLAPAAFAEPFDAVFSPPDAAKLMNGRIPDDEAAQAAWFAAVQAALATGGEPAALWIAGHTTMFQRRFGAPRPDGRGRAPIVWGPAHVDAVELAAAFALVSGRPEWPIGRRIDRRWSPKTSLRSLADHMRTWLERVARELCSDAPPAGAAWGKTQTVGGFKFAPRHTPEALIREGRLMRNCVGSYAQAVAEGACLIYAVRRGGVPVATLEVRAGPRPGEAEIVQLEGPGNTAAAPEVDRAAKEWLRRQGRCPLRRRGFLAAEIDAERWAKAFAPYAAAQRDAGRRTAAAVVAAPVGAGEQRMRATLRALEALAAAS